MAYQAGDTILDDEYNNFVAKSDSTFGYNIFAGTTAADTDNFDLGLGQTNISTVSATDTITAAQWNSLFTGITNIANHTNDTLTSATAVSVGDAIAIKAALIADLGTLRTSIQGGCANAVAGLTTTGTLQTGTSSSTWYGSFTSTFTITFSNAAQMRYFFNAGGKIRVSGARTGNGATGGGATSKDSNWTQLYTDLGNITIASKESTRSGTGATLTTDGLANGFHDLSTGETTIIRLTEDSSPYTANYIDVTAQLNAAVGTATEITVRVKSIDGAADTTYTAGNTESVDATPDRNGTHQHYLVTINPNTADGLATAYTPSLTAVSAATT
jgi:hypothetical protein